MDTNYKHEFVLSLAQPYLQSKKDYVNSQLVSKFLNKVGTENPFKPVAPFGWSLVNKRKKKDYDRIEKHKAKHNLNQVYMVTELEAIHEKIKKLDVFDILDVNSSIDYLNNNSFINELKAGFYLPVLYKGQRKPLYSMVFELHKHSIQEMQQFKKNLKKLQIDVVFHPAVNDYIYDYALSLQNQTDHPDYVHTTQFRKLPRPFRWLDTTNYYRWYDIHERLVGKKALITIG
jgi:hypothetical protein